MSNPSVSSEATVPTPPQFTQGANAGKTGAPLPEDSNNIPPERSFSSLGSTKQPVNNGPKTYHEYGAKPPVIPVSTTERQE